MRESRKNDLKIQEIRLEDDGIHKLYSMMKDAMILFIITLVAGLLLGGVYQMTRDPIMQAEEKALLDAYARVHAQASSFEAIEVNPEVLPMASAVAGEDTIAGTGGAPAVNYEGVRIDGVQRAVDDAGNGLGYVLQVTSQEGYGGDITFTMGISAEGMLNGISILQIAETPGLGMEAETVLVPQFAGKESESFSLTKGGAAAESQIDAISGATITSEAFVNAVNAGLYYFRTELGGDSHAAERN